MGWRSKEPEHRCYSCGLGINQRWSTCKHCGANLWQRTAERGNDHGTRGLHLDERIPKREGPSCPFCGTPQNKKWGAWVCPKCKI